MEAPPTPSQVIDFLQLVGRLKRTPRAGWPRSRIPRHPGRPGCGRAPQLATCQSIQDAQWQENARLRAMLEARLMEGLPQLTAHCPAKA